jgi:hypothetical protein
MTAWTSSITHDERYRQGYYEKPSREDKRSSRNVKSTA